MGCSGLAKLLRQVTIVQEVRMKSTKGKAAGCALAVGAVVAWRGGSLFVVAVSACAVVYLCELSMGM